MTTFGLAGGVFVGGGGGGGGVVVVVLPAVTLTLSNVDVSSCDVSWLVTIRPASALAVIDVEVLPTPVHVVPSLDTEPVTVAPLRDSFSHAGIGCDPPAMNVVVPPDAERVMNSMLPSGRTSRITCGA